MSKTETVRQLNAAATAQRLEGIARQIETVRQAKAQSVEELAATLEPLAQAMARLTDETSQHLTRVEEVVLRQAAKFEDQLEAQAATQLEQGLGGSRRKPPKAGRWSRRR